MRRDQDEGRQSKATEKEWVEVVAFISRKFPLRVKGLAQATRDWYLRHLCVYVFRCIEVHLSQTRHSFWRGSFAELRVCGKYLKCHEHEH